ncbi:hypothetical protein [Streptosporangium sandarakinum]|uniref:hypothetical protein n=1 Tax=Streptosporangium sandarakinum TaxID=1260955 RepID=UPI00371F58F9
MAAGRALEEDEPERAYEHTKVARRFAARIGVVREAVGIAAYRSGHFAEALSDLRAARRMTGSDAYLPVMADCERGLGRPERALDLVRSQEAERLDRVGKIELAIVESGARRDLGQNDAAVITLQRLPELRDTRPHPWSARLAFAYADALAEAGHEEPAVEWFGRAMAFDEDGETDAAERYAQLTGTVIEDLEEDEDFDEIEVDDAATLDAQLEDEADLDEDGPDFGDVLPEEGPAAEEETPAEAAGEAVLGDEAGKAGTEADEAGKAGAEETEADDEAAGAADADAAKTAAKVEAGVGPAFIEPDFGDVLGDSNEDEDEDKDEDKKK